MAKRQAAEAEAATTDALAEVSPIYRKQMEALRGPVASVIQAYSVGREKVAEIAPKIIGLYKKIDSDTGLTFVSFVRFYAPDLPEKADGDDGYRNHKAYYTLDYMRTVVRRQQAAKEGGNKPKERNMAVDALARALKTALQVVKPSDVDEFWTAVSGQLKIRAKLLDGLKERVAATKPIILLKVKPVGITADNVIQMPKTLRVIKAEQKETATAKEPMAQKGQRVSRSA